MARALSSAWAFQSMKDVKATFLKGQPHMKLVFSEQVRLHKFTSTPLFEKWLSENSGLVHHQKGTKRVFDTISKQFGKDATNGLLFIDGKFECYTLEDEYRTVKVMHETCIPEGTYPIEFRTVGGFDAKYTKRYGADFHKGMLWIRGVPEFEYILIHTGNTDSHTSGCLLVG